VREDALRDALWQQVGYEVICIPDHALEKGLHIVTDRVKTVI
jgi:very-short-patch-repair endonuclease